MQKIAQRRSVLNKLREMTNVSGIAAEKFFNPEFQRVMESLREKDDQIRSLVAGDSIGMGDPGSDAVSLKELLKSSKSNLNRREYMSAIAELGRFHKKLFDVVQEIGKLAFDVDKVHHEFLFKDLDEEKKQHLQDLKTRFAKESNAALVKEASIMDFFYNIGTKRGRALAAWEKRYPKQVGKLKKDTAMLQARSEGLLAQVLSALKEMASARSTRNVDAYTKAADKITKSYQGYDKTFRDYYTANVKGFLEKVELISPTEKTDKKENKELGSQEVPVDKAPDGVPDSIPGAPDTIKDLNGPPTVEEGHGTVHVPSSKPKTLNQGPSSGIWDPKTQSYKPVSSIPFDLIQRKTLPPGSAPQTVRTGPPSDMPMVYQPTMPAAGVQPPSTMRGMPSLPQGSIRDTEISPAPALSQPPSQHSGVAPRDSHPTDLAPAPMMSEPPPSAGEIEELGGSNLARVMRESQTSKANMHKRFYESLESMANESPLVMANYIKRYATTIQKADPSVAIQLMQIVKSIRG